MALLTRVDTDLIVPIVIILCVLGSYAIGLSFVDAVTAVAFGFLSYLLLKYEYSLVALIMGVILGPIIEQSVHRSFQLGDASIFVSSTVGVILVVLIVATLGWPPAKVVYRRYLRAG